MKPTAVDLTLRRFVDLLLEEDRPRILLLRSTLGTALEAEATDPTPP